MEGLRVVGTAEEVVRARLLALDALDLRVENATTDPLLLRFCRALLPVLQCRSIYCTLYDEADLWCLTSTLMEPTDAPLKFPLAVATSYRLMFTEHPEVFMCGNLGRERPTNSALARNLTAHLRDVDWITAAPLVSSTGVRIGTLIAAAGRGKDFLLDEARAMCALAELVIRHIEHDHLSALRELQGVELVRPVEAAETAVIVVNTSLPGWPIIYASASWATKCGVPAAALFGNKLWDLYKNATSSQESNTGNRFMHRVNSFERFSVGLQLLRKAEICNESLDVQVTNFRPLLDEEPFDRFCQPINIPESRCSNSEPIIRVRSVYIGVLMRTAGSASFVKHLSSLNISGKSTGSKGDVPMKEPAKDAFLPTCCMLS